MFNLPEPQGNRLTSIRCVEPQEHESLLPVLTEMKTAQQIAASVVVVTSIRQSEANLAPSQSDNRGALEGVLSSEFNGLLSQIYKMESEVDAREDGAGSPTLTPCRA